jgi:26S proteasome regulatory subunit N5
MAERLIDIGSEEMWTPFLEEANALFIEEKKARHDNDAIRISEICQRVVQIAFDNREFKHLNKFMLALTKKRGQAKKAITEMIQLCVTFIEKMPTRMEKLDLIQAVREATEGKFYVEIEFARCTWMYSEMKEEDGELRAAADVILDV